MSTLTATPVQSTLTDDTETFTQLKDHDEPLTKDFVDEVHRGLRSTSRSYRYEPSDDIKFKRNEIEKADHEKLMAGLNSLKLYASCVGHDSVWAIRMTAVLTVLTRCKPKGFTLILPNITKTQYKELEAKCDELGVFIDYSKIEHYTTDQINTFKNDVRDLAKAREKRSESKSRSKSRGYIPDDRNNNQFKYTNLDKLYNQNNQSFQQVPPNNQNNQFFQQGTPNNKSKQSFQRGTPNNKSKKSFQRGTPNNQNDQFFQQVNQRPSRKPADGSQRVASKSPANKVAFKSPANRVPAKSPANRATDRSQSRRTSRAPLPVGQTSSNISAKTKELQDAIAQMQEEQKEKDKAAKALLEAQETEHKKQMFELERTINEKEIKIEVLQNAIANIPSKLVTPVAYKGETRYCQVGLGITGAAAEQAAAEQAAWYPQQGQFLQQ